MPGKTNTKVQTIVRINKNSARPLLILQGAWLAESGFHTDTLVLAEFAEGRIALAPKGQGTDIYLKLAPSARKGKKSLFQVGGKRNHFKDFPILYISGNQMIEAGFMIGDVVAARYAKDAITVIKIDLDFAWE